MFKYIRIKFCRNTVTLASDIKLNYFKFVMDATVLYGLFS